MRSTAVLALTLGLIPMSSLADDRDDRPFAVGARAGTLGLGLEVSTTVLPDIQARVGFNSFDYDYDDSASDIDYELDLGLSSVSLMVDWRPGGGGFRLGAGMLLNDNELNALGKPSTSYAIGDMVFDAGDVGTLTGRIEFEEYAPVLGLGWDTAFAAQRLGVSVDLGVVLQGSPKVSLSADGPIASDPLFQAELEQEQANFQDAIDGFEYYPVAAVGLNFRF